MDRQIDMDGVQDLMRRLRLPRPSGVFRNLKSGTSISLNHSPPFPFHFWPYARFFAVQMVQWKLRSLGRLHNNRHEITFIHSFIHSFILFYKRDDKTQTNKQCTKIENIRKIVAVLIQHSTSEEIAFRTGRKECVRRLRPYVVMRWIVVREMHVCGSRK